MKTLKIKSAKKSLFLLSATGLAMTSQLMAKTTSGTATPMETAMQQIRDMFTGPLAMIIGAIALVIGVITFLLSNDDNMAPVMRILLKVIFAMSLLTGGTALLTQLFPAASMLP